ncbi:MAG: YHS domain-containing (seleno)protein [Pseudomonadota bacterium]
MRALPLTFILGAPLAIGLASPAFAEDEYNVTSGYTLDGVGLGVHGVDTVVLSTTDTVAQGDAAHTVVHDGVAYYFGSQITAQRFQEDPDRYLPQYGGFCAYAVALGRKLDGDPRYADIVDGRLYLFVNAVIFERYLADREGTLRRAAEMWPTIQHERVEDL